MRDILSKLDKILTESTVAQGVDEANAAQQAAIAISKKQRGETPKNEEFEIGDDFGISFSEDFEIATEIVDILEDGIVIELDDRALEMLTNEGLNFLDGELEESVAGPKKCWKGYRKTGTQSGTGKNAGKRVNDCEKIKKESVKPKTTPVNEGDE